jgi:acetyl-CoA carboxylase biotin carboxyl carrier protein
MDLTPQDVQDILQILDSTAYQELSLQTDRFSLRLRRDAQGTWTQTSQVLADARLSAAPAGARPDGAATAVPPPSAASAPSAPGLVDVVAPLMGNFYLSPKPGAPAFVEVGARVDEDTVVGLIETMKLFTSVYANVKGSVAEILLVNAAYADQGAVLLRVKPDAAA